MWTLDLKLQVLRTDTHPQWGCFSQGNSTSAKDRAPGFPHFDHWFSWQHWAGQLVNKENFDNNHYFVKNYASNFYSWHQLSCSTQSSIFIGQGKTSKEKWSRNSPFIRAESLGIHSAFIKPFIHSGQDTTAHTAQFTSFHSCQHWKESQNYLV